MPGDIINEAISYLEAHENHCILLVLGAGERLAPAPLSQVPVLKWTWDHLAEGKDRLQEVKCGSMVVTHDGSRENWSKLLPWIHSPVVITQSIDSVSDIDLHDLRRLEPTFFMANATDEGDPDVPRFSVYTWHMYKDLKKLAIYDGSYGYHQKNDMYTRTLALSPGYQLDFAGHDFPAVAFTFQPFSLPDYENQENNGGFEYEIAHAVTRGLRLRLVVNPPSTGGKWGSVDAHGNYTGNNKWW